MVELEKNNNGPSFFSFTWKKFISFFHLGKQILCFIMWQTKIMKKTKQSISLSSWKTILYPMWKQQHKRKQSSLFFSCKNKFFFHVEHKKQQPFLLLSFFLMCWNDPFSQIILSFMYIVEFYIWLLPWCCSPCSSSSSIFFFSYFLPHFHALVPFSSIFCVILCSNSCISTWQ